MQSVWQLVSDTPWYVYVILILLINLGIRASKTQVIPLRKLFIIPVVFTALSLHTLMTSVAFSYTNLACWFITILISAVLGWYQVARFPIKVDRENKLIKVPGTWSTLIIILLIFASKYYIGYQLAVHPYLLGQPSFEMIILAVAGFCNGWFIGKLACYIQRYIKLPSTELIAS